MIPHAHAEAIVPETTAHHIRPDDEDDGGGGEAQAASASSAPPEVSPGMEELLARLKALKDA